MKILVHLLVVLSGTSLFAQDYIPVLRNENQWEIFDYDYEFNPDCGWQYGSRYYFDGDSLIGDQQYLKLGSISFDGSGSPFFCPPFTLGDVPNEWVYFIREDSLSQQVFLWNGSEEVILYDFSLQVGDEITVSDVNFTYNCEVTFTETITTDDGVDRKRIQLEDPSSASYHEWVEGIGSVYGLVTQFGIGFGAGRTLLCFRQEEQGIFGEDCGLILGLGESSLGNGERVIINPNPSSGILRISLTGQMEIIRLTLHDAQGMRVYDSSVNELRNSLFGASNQLSINLHSYPSGIYFIQAQSQDKSFSGLWVKE